jgi:tripartite-type tricarboxylate transporter receptor subunit TctC
VTLRRLVCVLALALPAVGGGAAPVAAFPDKPIELTVLFGAGSAADLLARKLAELAGRTWASRWPSSTAPAPAAPSATPT